ncbi:hypothetical protein KIW84_042911 [Lathyrus oleraceus]|uniref:Trichome birefringence-like C-terminal domain-containing protein n=1 Tax=Pisum sativum TaxID=3888 RepID=A0A9D4XC96_PEA|nr:hypothetical protein KIW84_042911 [Pisum sativum]
MATGGKRVQELKTWGGNMIEGIADDKNLAIKSVVRWLDLQLVLHPLLKVFLRILSPRHFFNEDWNTDGSCDNIIPLSNGNEASQVGSSDPVIESALKIYKNPIPQPVETFTVAKCPIKGVGAHVTSSGDLKNQFEETNVGFDTSCKKISDVVQARAEQDKYHGVILLLEGLVESIPEIYALLKEIHVLLQQGVAADKIFVHLSPWASTLFEFLPPFIRRQLLLYTEPDDSTQSSQIETEKFLAYLVEGEINKVSERRHIQRKLQAQQDKQNLRFHKEKCKFRKTDTSPSIAAVVTLCCMYGFVAVRGPVHGQRVRQSDVGFKIHVKCNPLRLQDDKPVQPIAMFDKILKLLLLLLLQYKH